VPLLLDCVPLLAALACLLQRRACDFLGLVRTHAMGPVADQALLDGVRLAIEGGLRVRIVDILVESHGEPSLLRGVLHWSFQLTVSPPRTPSPRVLRSYGVPTPSGTMSSASSGSHLHGFRNISDENSHTGDRKSIV